MKKFEVWISAETLYTIEAENETEAIDKAFEYWENYEPYYEAHEIEEDDEV